MPPAELIARRAVKRAVGRLGQKKMDSGKYDMVVENRSAGRIVRLLYGPMRASSLQQKNSFLEGKLGEKIASEKFTIIDDPFIKSGLGSRLYDGEGLAAQRRVMIENGILKSYYVDSYYGRKLGMEPTTGSSSNLVVEPGAESMEDLVRKMKKGILVTGFIGGNSNSTTGDFSVGIYGVYVEDGETAGPVYEMNISGNLTELMDRLVEVGNDPNVYSSWRIPSLYFADVQFSGI
jgi:PmbA protein